MHTHNMSHASSNFRKSRIMHRKETGSIYPGSPTTNTSYPTSSLTLTTTATTVPNRAKVTVLHSPLQLGLKANKTTAHIHNKPMGLCYNCLSIICNSLLNSPIPNYPNKCP